MEDLCANPRRFRFMKPEQRSDWSFQTMAVSLRKENLEHCENPSLSVVLRALPEGAEFIPSDFNRHKDVVAQLAGTEWSRWSPVEGPTIYNRNYVHRPDKVTLNVLQYCDYASRKHLNGVEYNLAEGPYVFMPHVWNRKPDSWKIR